MRRSTERTTVLARSRIRAPSGVHDALVAAGHAIVTEPLDGPFGRTFTFADPDGYRITLHDRS